MASRFECSFCLDPFSDPRFLPCPGHHTFCRGCLEKYLMTTVRSTRPGTIFKCPNCRSQVKLPKDGVHGLMINYYITDKKQDGKKSSYRECTIHPEEDLRFYCLPCDEIICRDCKIVSHEGHKTDMVKNVTEELKTKVETLLETAEMNLNAREKELFTEATDHEESEVFLKQTVEKLKTEIDCIIKLFIRVTKPRYILAKENKEKIIEWAEESFQQISDYRDLLEYDLKDSISADTIQGLKDLVECLEGLQKTNTPPKLHSLGETTGYICKTKLQEEISMFSEKVLKATRELNSFISSSNNSGIGYGETACLTSSDKQQSTDTVNSDPQTDEKHRNSDKKAEVGSIDAVKPSSVRQQICPITFKRIWKTDMIKATAEIDTEWPTPNGRTQQDWTGIEIKIPKMKSRARHNRSTVDENLPFKWQVKVSDFTPDTNEEDLRKLFENFGTTDGILYDEQTKEQETAKNIRDEEEKLMVNAWYNLGMRLNRQAAEDRLNNSTSGQAFLNRQRQAHLRGRPNIPNSHPNPSRIVRSCPT